MKIEGAARGVTGVEEVRVSIASQLMSLTAKDASSTAAVERAVTDLGYRLDRLDAPEPGGDGPLPGDPAQLAPGYRRAPWTVVVLHVGYGVVEMAGCFIAGSQEPKAAARDGVGGCLLTFLGLPRTGWSLGGRA